MKKRLCLVIALILTLVFALSACGKTCHTCGENAGKEPLEFGGRYYCDYECYMKDVLFG